MQPWTTLGRRTLLDCGRFLLVESHRIQLPDGTIIEDWPWVVTPAYVNVVAETEAGQFVCLRQTKYAIAGVSLAPVGGYLDDGEQPEAAAKRELLEEIGFEATEWIHLASYPVDGNRGSGVAHLYLARRARCVSSRVADDLEEQEVLLLSREALESALDAGDFRLLPWAAAVALALRHLESTGDPPH